jgi:hypothetical protein
MFHVDHQLVFGGGTSSRVWCNFAGMILTVFRRSASSFLYVDDFFGADALKLRVPRLFARAQADLLDIFQHLGIPYDLAKAPAGRAIKIIGLFVDLNTFSIGLSPSRRDELLSAISAFAAADRATVQQLRQLAGWISWASQAMPQLRPFTFSVYVLRLPRVGLSGITPHRYSFQPGDTPRFGNARTDHARTRRKNVLVCDVVAARLGRHHRLRQRMLVNPRDRDTFSRAAPWISLHLPAERGSHQHPGGLRYVVGMALRLCPPREGGRPHRIVLRQHRCRRRLQQALFALAGPELARAIGRMGDTEF